MNKSQIGLFLLFTLTLTSGPSADAGLVQVILRLKAEGFNFVKLREGF